MTLKFSPSILAALVFLCGCSAKKTSLVPNPEQKSAQATDTMINKTQTYIVKKGDSLWKIAANPKVYGDAFQWPLLFKQNRDQIQDPDLIEVRQDLGIRKSVSEREIRDAIQKAKDTPPFVPHSTPRKSLPVKY